MFKAGKRDGKSRKSGSGIKREVVNQKLLLNHFRNALISS